MKQKEELVHPKGGGLLLLFNISIYIFEVKQHGQKENE
jgi:hypothetical protein